jgi:hypothetical protein
LDVSVGTVKSRILRGRGALREILAPLWKARHARQHAPAAEMDEAVPALAGMRASVWQGGGK